ncbi:MAG: IS66-like element accessory protein TnpA [Methylovirgula sp.]
MRTPAGVDLEGGGEVFKVDARGRRSWSLEQRQRIVAEARAPHASVAEVARRHGLNANLIFKWLKRAKEGWPDRRRALAAPSRPMTFVPVEVTTQTGGKETAGPAHKLTIDHAVPARTQDPPPKPSRKPLREAKVPAPRGVIEISLRNGARVSVDADVNEAALRLVLSAMKEL